MDLPFPIVLLNHLILLFIKGKTREIIPPPQRGEEIIFFGESGGGRGRWNLWRALIEESEL